ncbi:MAG: immunoglobulin domain-containing protein [Chitinispirillaceae bacterium]|nr:immunoglobulin domain-containing protein [Chitinispirillaceae bacterium]
MRAQIFLLYMLKLTAIAALSIIRCAIPNDPDDPSNTRMNLILINSELDEANSTITDSTGNTIRIGMVLKLPENIDSIRLKIVDEETTLFDTLFKDLATGRYDTLWKKVSFSAPGTKTVTATAYSSQDLAPMVGVIKVVGEAIAPPNAFAPKITFTGNRFIRPLATCTLYIKASDEDSGQHVSVSMEENPEGAVFSDESLFVWTAPENSSGDYEVKFKVTDDGIPPRTDSLTVEITVLTDSVNHAPIWNSDTLYETMQDTGIFILTLSELCSDPDGDPTAYTLLAGGPDGDTITSEIYSFSLKDQFVGMHFIAIVAEDPDSENDTLVIVLTVVFSPETGAVLSSVKVSAGTLREIASPVPDTMRDTVSFIDSTITLILDARDSSSIITINDEETSGGKTSSPFALETGTNTLLIRVSDTGETVHNNYILIVVRKPETTIDLTSAPEGPEAVAESGSSIRISWDDLFGAYSYTIQRSDVADDGFGDIGTSTGNSFIDTGLTEGATWYYRVIATNSSSSSPASEVVHATTLERPSIDGSVQPVTVAAGQEINLSVTASGTAPLSYQWQKDGEDLEGETGTTLTIASAELSDEGKYRVVVSNSVTSVNSNEVQVTVLPVYTLTVNRTATGGSVAVEKDSTVYITGASVTLTATPDDGYRFDGWSGDTSGTANPLMITMEKDRVITANYKKIYTLVFGSSDPDKGTVTSDVGTSPAVVDSGEIVTITATANSGYRFSEWGGDTTVIANPLTVTMLKNRNITAEYQKTYVLTLVSSDVSRGSVALTQGTSPITVDSGEVVGISANAESGYKFKQWSTTAAGVTITAPTATSTSVILRSGNATVTGEFGCYTFEKQLNFSQYPNMYLNDAVQTADGGYLVVGYAGTDEKALIIKINEEGDTVWTKTENDLTKPKTIRKAPAGYLVSGQFYTSPTVQCYGQGGGVIWGYSYPHLESGSANVAIATKDNGYVVGGVIGSMNFLLVKINSSRGVEWDTVHDVYYTDGVDDCIQTRDNGYVFVGQCNANLSPIAIKTDNTGSFLWELSNSSIPQNASTPSFVSIDTTSDGGCVISGNAGFDGQNNGFMLGVSASGTVSTGGAVIFGNTSRCNGIKCLKNGDLLIAGGTLTLGSAGGEDIYIARTTANGIVVYESTFGAADNEYARSLQLTSDGGAVVVGNKNWIIKTDKNGTIN